MSQTTKMWVTKYALSSGIVCLEGDVRDDWFYPNSQHITSIKIGRDAFATRDEAVRAAELARAKKIKSLRGQIEALEKMALCILRLESEKS